jgi:hypothetical protein
MIITSSQIDKLLATLEDLLAQIDPLRRKADELRQALEHVHRDYDQRLRQLNLQAEALETRRRALRTWLARGYSESQAPEGPRESSKSPSVHKGLDKELLPPDSPGRLRANRKRALADHIFYFLEVDQHTNMQLINTVMIDDERDLGDMLEILAWGPIWMARAEWESLEDQATRLELWCRTLEERLAYWQMEIRHLESDQNFALLQIMQTSDRETWLDYLNEMAGRQLIENEQLSQEIAVLEETWRAHQEGETTGV